MGLQPERGLAMVGSGLVLVGARDVRGGYGY